MKPLRSLIVSAAIPLSLAGCTNRSSPVTLDHDKVSGPVAAVESRERSTPSAALLSISGGGQTDAALSQELPVQFDRKIIRNATLTIETDDPAAAQRAVGSIAELHGGFVVTSEYKTATSQQSGVTVNVVLRVPSNAFDAALSAVRASGERVIEENVSGKDVTEEYIDLEARIRTKKALEAQFLEIMKQARGVTDALEVQSQIADVRGEIERLEGRRRYLENQTTLSTITVSFRTPAPVVTVAASGIGQSIKEAFGESVDVAVSIVLGLIRLVIVSIPIIVLILLPAGLALRFLFRRYHTREKVESAIPAE